MNRVLFNIIISSLFILLTSFLSIDVFISGKVLKASSNRYLPLKEATVLVKYRGQIVARSKSDRLGRYELKINVGLSDGLAYSYDFYVVSKKADTCFIKSMKQFKSDEFTWNIKLPASCK